MKHEHLEIHCNYAQAGIDKPDYQPLLHTYILENYPEIQPFRKRPVVIICPGGGYERTSVREGEHIAIRMNSFGFNACILKYSCKPAVYPAPQLELAASIALVRQNAARWHIDPRKVIVAGFSAGGHLAASLGVMWNKSLLSTALSVKPANIRPDGLLLSYPVITSGKYAHKGSFKALLGTKHDEILDTVSLEKHVSADTPPTFLWHTVEDLSVPVENSLLFANALRKFNRPFEMHIFPRGGHGLAAANSETMMPLGIGIQPECESWIDMAATWIRNL